MSDLFKNTGATFDEPLEMLKACHERIEDKLATLERLAPHVASHGADAEARTAAEGVLKYFNTAGVLHHEDEDHDLFPLLRVRAAERQRVEVAAAIGLLEREHATMAAQWDRLRHRLEELAQGRGGLDAEEVGRFARLYREHMGREGAVVLPFAAASLTPEEHAALGKRMAARRGTKT